MNHRIIRSKNLTVLTLDRSKALPIAVFRNASSTPALSNTFDTQFIEKYINRKFQPINYYKDPNCEIVDFNQGQISYRAFSVSLALIGIAFLMGASDIYIAGMDGFLAATDDGEYLYYDETDFDQLK